MIPTGKENLENMEKCPRFEGCSISKCPLDYWINERTKLSEDEKCILFRLCGKRKSNKMKGILSPKMKDVVRFVWDKKSKIAVA